jgi:hypothetical protein
MKYLLVLSLLALFFVSCVKDVKKDSKNTTQTSNKNQADTTITENISETLPTFQIYGELAPVGYLDSKNPITEKYGFFMERIAGCAVGSDEAKEVSKNNAEALVKMNVKYGDNWQANFEKETGYKLWIPFD